MKTILRGFLLILVLAGSYTGYKLLTNQTQAIPLPYQVNQQALNINAPIVIVGDRQAVYLSKFQDILANKVSEGLSNKIQIQSFASRHEGLHRSLAKVKAMNPPPKVLIYLGASEEWYEKKYELRELFKVSKNLKLYENPWIQTLVKIQPWVSKVIYHNTTTQKLGTSINKYQEMVTADIRLISNTIRYKFYRYELEDLFKYADEKKIKIISLTSPINLNSPPKLNCPGSLQSDPSTVSLIRQNLKKGDTKTALTSARDLTLVSSGFAEGYFLLGKVYMAMDDRVSAFQSFNKAVAFDCKNWRSNPIYNVILSSMTAYYRQEIFDFNNFVSDHWKEQDVYQNDILPQDIFWESAAALLGQKIKKMLQI
jgi:hypothetical protein